MGTTKIIVLDDDPTGSQTVHSCLLLTRWDVDTLREAMDDDAPLFFVLTNTRGMDADKAAAVTREVCRNLGRVLEARAAEGRPVNPILVSRSDSTLRGHYPIETDVMAEELGAALGGIDAHFLVPAFFEGGRITVDGVHYLVVDGKPVPVHETEFARDSVFGYRHSYLPMYVEEKTGGRIPADAVQRIGLAELRSGCKGRLMTLTGNVCCTVDAERQDDLNRFAACLLAAAAEGKRFLLRSAASLLTSLARLPAQPLPAHRMAACVRGGRPGVVLVGSYVGKTTEQLHRLLEEPDVAPVEIDVTRLPEERAALVDAACRVVSELHGQGLVPVIYTSRGERTFAAPAERLAFGEAVSGTLMDIVRALPEDIGFLISKGGITSNDVLSSGLGLRTARVLGQILAGCSVVRCPADHPRYPDLPVVIFPGNVGGSDALATVFRRLAGPDSGAW